jgi:hypothetical protein
MFTETTVANELSHIEIHHLVPFATLDSVIVNSNLQMTRYFEPKNRAFYVTYP